MLDLSLKNPSYVVIFRSLLSDNDKGYQQAAKNMEALVSQQEGFIALHSLRSGAFGITISYWESLQSIENWKKNTKHSLVQEKGKRKWYDDYSIQVCKIIKNYKKKNETISVDNT